MSAFVEITNFFFFPCHLWQVCPPENPVIVCAWLRVYLCTLWPGFPARIRGGCRSKVWVAPDYTLIITLWLGSELPLQSASLGFYMCPTGAAIWARGGRAQAAHSGFWIVLQESLTRNQIRGPNHQSCPAPKLSSDFSLPPVQLCRWTVSSTSR